MDEKYAPSRPILLVNAERNTFIPNYTNTHVEFCAHINALQKPCTSDIQMS